ncbi:MAG: hypothetical protein RLZ26_2161 [Pseudomonadota bacterium]
MTLIGRIIGTWRDPRGAIRALLAGPAREDRALAVLMGAAALVVVGEIPAATAAAARDPAIPLDARIGGALMGAVFVLPLFAYALAAASRIVARLFGGRGSWFGARMALFWALLAVQPAVLIHAALEAVVGRGAVSGGVGIVAFAGFLYLWLGMLIAAESPATAERV